MFYNEIYILVLYLRKQKLYLNSNKSPKCIHKHFLSVRLIVQFNFTVIMLLISLHYINCPL